MEPKEVKTSQIQEVGDRKNEQNSVNSPKSSPSISNLRMNTFRYQSHEEYKKYAEGLDCIEIKPKRKSTYELAIKKLFESQKEKDTKQQLEESKIKHEINEKTQVDLKNMASQKRNLFTYNPQKLSFLNPKVSRQTSKVVNPNEGVVHGNEKKNDFGCRHQKKFYLCKNDSSRRNIFSRSPEKHSKGSSNKPFSKRIHRFKLKPNPKFESEHL